MPEVNWWVIAALATVVASLWLARKISDSEE